MFAMNIGNFYKKYTSKKKKKLRSLSIVHSKCGHKYDEKSTKILKILGLVNNIEEYQKIYDDA